MEKIIKRCNDLMEVFLDEFCNVHKITEDTLCGHLAIVNCLADNSIMAVNIDDLRDVVFGIHFDLKIKDRGIVAKYEVFGGYLSQKEKYPKTTEAIKGVQNEE